MPHDKANLYFIQTAPSQIEEYIQILATHFNMSHNVHCLRIGTHPDGDFRLPPLGVGDTVISVSDESFADQVKLLHPDIEVAYWDTSNEFYLPEVLVNLLRPTVIRGDFEIVHNTALAQAM